MAADAPWKENLFYSSIYQMQKSKQKDIEDYDRTQIPHPFPINQCLENKKNLLVQMLLIVHAYFKLCLNPTEFNLKVKDEIINLFDKIVIGIYD